MGVEQHDTYQHDALLVARAAGGDQSAFRQLFDAYAPLVYRITSRMLGDRDEASDVTQDIFVRAFQRLSSLRDGQAFKAWLTRLAVNMVRDHARRARAKTVSLDAPIAHDGGELAWEIADERPGSEARVLAGELAAQVQGALLALSADHRTVVVLHHLEGLPVEEIAAVLGVPAGTVKSRLARARAELRQHLAPYIET